MVLQIAAVAPAIYLYSQLITAFAKVFRDIKLGGRHGVLTITYLLPIHPDVEGGMYTSEMQDEVLREHLLRHLDKRYIRTHRVAVLVGCPVLRWLCGHAGTVSCKRVSDISINRYTIALQLPVARNGYLTPCAHIIVLAIEVGRTLFGVTAPMEQPLPVEVYNLLTLLLLGRQLQGGMIRQFVDAQHSGILPVVRRRGGAEVRDMSVAGVFSYPRAPVPPCLPSRLCHSAHPCT